MDYLLLIKKYYLNFVLNNSGGGGGADKNIPSPSPVKSNLRIEEEEEEKKKEKSEAIVSKGASKPTVTAAQEALENSSSKHSRIELNPIAAFNIHHCIQWRDVVNESIIDEDHFEEKFTKGEPIKTILEGERESKLGMNETEYTKHLRASCKSRGKQYLLRGKLSSKSKGGKEKYLYDTDEYYTNKYIKYKTKYLELKNMLN